MPLKVVFTSTMLGEGVVVLYSQGIKILKKERSPLHLEINTMLLANVT